MSVPGATDVIKERAGSGRRFHDMDALRAFALLLGVLLHGAVAFVPLDFWPVQETYAYTTDYADNPYGYLIAAIHSFRMPLFFVLSGFFTLMLWQSRGLRRLVEHRLRRIGLPLLVCMFTVIPTVAWLFAGDEWEIAYWPVAWLVGGFAHLWFLWYLLLAVAVFAVAARLGVNFGSRLWWLLIPAVSIPQYMMEEGSFGADTPFGVAPPPHLFAYYMLFFMFGAFFYSRGISVRR